MCGLHSPHCWEAWGAPDATLTWSRTPSGEIPALLLSGGSLITAQDQAAGRQHCVPLAAFPGHQKGTFPATIWLLNKQTNQARLPAAVDGSKVMQQCSTVGKNIKWTQVWCVRCPQPTDCRAWPGNQGNHLHFCLATEPSTKYQTKTPPWILGTTAKGSWDTYGCSLPAITLLLAGYPAFQLSWKSDAPAPAQCHTRLGTGAQGAPLTWSLLPKEHTGSSCALPAGLASALTAPLPPSFCHPCPCVPSRQPGAAPAWRHLWCQCRTGVQSPIHLSWGVKRD